MHVLPVNSSSQKPTYFSRNSFSGKILYTDMSGGFISGWSYKNGKIAGEIKESESTGGAAETQRLVANPEDCVVEFIDYYERYCYYQSNGELSYCTDWEYIGSTVHTICPTQPDGPGGGGGGGGGILPPDEPDPIVTVEVINNLTSECFKQFVSRIGNSKLKSEIAKLYQNTFVGTNKIFNIKFQEQLNLQHQGQSVPAYSQIDPNNSNTWVVTLNTTYANIGTQESWGQAILHEILHGFIEKNDLNFTNNTTWSQEHEIMLTDWITQTQSALAEIYELSNYDALALSLQGMNDILMELSGEFFLADWIEWIEDVYNINLEDADEVYEQYVEGFKGTLCSI